MKTEIAKCLKVIQTTYPNAKFEDEELAVNVWEDSLKKYPINLVKSVILEICRTSKFPPSLSEVIGRIEVKSLSLDSISPEQREHRRIQGLYDKLSETEKSNIDRDVELTLQGKQSPNEYVSEIVKLRIELNEARKAYKENL